MEILSFMENLGKQFADSLKAILEAPIDGTNPIPFIEKVKGCFWGVKLFKPKYRLN